MALNLTLESSEIRLDECPRIHPWISSSAKLQASSISRASVDNSLFSNLLVGIEDTLHDDEVSLREKQKG